MVRRKNRKTAARARLICLLSTLLLIATLTLSRSFEKTEPVVRELCEAEFKSLITKTVYSITKNMDMANIVEPIYSEKNRIASLSTDTAELNRVCAEIVSRLEEELGEDDIIVKIPIGDVIGNSLSVGQGPPLILQINHYRSTHVEIKSDFRQSGINQTLHTLTLILDVETSVLLPGLKTEKIKACLSLPLSETLIVGDTPIAYSN